MKKIFTIIFLIIAFENKALVSTPHYLDFKLILNQSDAGKKAQKYLKNKLDNGLKNIRDKQKKILEEEKKLIQQKKVLSNEDYKSKVTELRSKVSSLQKERNSLMQSVAKQRSKAKSELLKNLNPIVKNFMKENKVRMVIDKKDVLLADEELDITSDIMKLLNKNLKSINLN